MHIITLEAVNEKLIALEKLIDVRFQLMESATKMAKSAADQRLEGMNQFRDQLTKQARDFMTQTEYDVRHKALEDKIENIASRVEERYETLSNRIDEKLTNLEKAIHGVELLKADITGRLWTLGIVITIVVVLLEFILHYIGKVHLP